MKELRLKTKQDIEDFLAGCAFYGTAALENQRSARHSISPGSFVAIWNFLMSMDDQSSKTTWVIW